MIIVIEVVVIGAELASFSMITIATMLTVPTIVLRVTMSP